MPAGAEIITAFEKTWVAIQARHPAVPDVVIITGTSRQAGGDRWGHHWPERWHQAAEVGKAAELFLAGELIARGPGAVLETVLHEAAHALAYVRGIKDTSRQGGRYHNKRFAALAAELGLSPPDKPSAKDGFCECPLSEQVQGDYADELWELHSARLAYLDDPRAVQPETGDDDAGGTPNGGEDGGRRAGRRVKVVCGCGRGLQLTPKSLDEGPVVCGLCGAPFEAQEDDGS